MRVVSLAVLLAATWCSTASAYFYVPGVTPKEYEDGQNVSVTVNSLRSMSAVVPYDFYHLPFCRPRDVYGTVAESMGQILAGDKMESSMYQLGMNQSFSCRKLSCDNTADVMAQLKELKSFIDQGYRGHMSIDNLPAFTPLDTPLHNGQCKNSPPLNYVVSGARGFNIGVPAWCTGKTLLNNHLAFEIRFHQPEGGLKRVVGFHVRPKSIMFGGDRVCEEGVDLTKLPPQPVELDAISENNRVQWTYSVTWVEDKVTTWAMRWDEFLNTSVADSSARVHWVYIINSILITICLCVIAGVMLMRTLHKECNEYNSQDADALAEEMGWKLVHADVFRPPQYAELLSIAVGNGAQMLLLAATVLVFALLGFLSPANRGGLLTALLICFALFSMASGYVTSRMLMTIAKKEWKVIFGSGMIFPGALFVCFIFIDLVNWHLGASDAVPFKNIVLIFFLWVGSCIPLNVLGAAYGFHQEGIKNPCSVGRLPREIPVQRWWLTPPALYILPATFPFCAVFLELRFIFDSIWLGYVYYAFTFLSVVFVVWVVTVMLTTMIMVYYMLAYGDYRWWWRSFIIGGGLGCHVYAFAIWFYFTSINITTMTGTLIFFVYMGFFALAYGLAAGTIGFLTSYAFVHRIYGSIRID